MNTRSGFSLIEVVLSAAIFVTFATGGVVAVVSALDNMRLGSEISIANQYTTEGMEAVRSIRNQSFSSVYAMVGGGNTGVAVNSGVWKFAGSSNQLASDTRFSRVISVQSVERDSSGNIVSSGGTLDANTVKVAVTTAWNLTAARPQSVVQTQYLTDWKSTIANVGDGVIVYGDAIAFSQPKYRTYSNASDSFTDELNIDASYSDLIAGKSFKIKTSPLKQEAIMGYVNGVGELRVLCFDGTTWTSDWAATVGGSGETQRFAIAYETNSGDALLVYSTNTGGSNELAYRTKQGTLGCGAANWSNATTFSTVRTTGTVQWIRMESSPVSGSNTIGIAWVDSNLDLSAMEWTGNSFGVAEPNTAFETNLESVGGLFADSPSFDIGMESQTGNLMVVWSPRVTSSCSAGNNCMRYARYSQSWSAVAAIPTVADEGTNIDLSANPSSNEMVLAALGNSSSDLSVAYWSGSSWSGRSNVDTSATTPVAGAKLVATGWLTSGASQRYVVVYHDSGSTNVGWYIGSGSGAPSKQSDFIPTPAFANPQGWYDIQLDPKNPDRLMFTVGDSALDIFAKRLVMNSTSSFTWSNSDSGAALETNTQGPFSYAYWKNL